MWKVEGTRLLDGCTLPDDHHPPLFDNYFSLINLSESTLRQCLIKYEYKSQCYINIEPAKL